MRNKKEKKPDVRYIPLEEVNKLNDVFLKELEGVRQRLSAIRDADVTKELHAVIIEAYKAAIDLKARECEVDYAIKCAEIEARAAELKPVRRKRWVFRPYTNRAQDIIDESAELEAERVHGAAEKLLDAARELLFPGKEKTRLKRKEQNREEAQKQFEENRRQAEKKLEEILRKADEEDEPAKVYEEPPAVPPAQESVTEIKKPLPGQMTFADVQEQARPVPFATSSRRPRPPRSCRKQ